MTFINQYTRLDLQSPEIVQVDGIPGQARDDVAAW